MNSDASSSRPSRVRYLVVMLATVMSILLYLDRYCITLAERYIKEDLALTESQIALYLSMFFWTYALAQVPSGWLTDRYGARLMLPLYILGWSLFTGLTGLVTGFVLLLVLRALFGLAQAGAYPTAASSLSKWMPISSRGKASGAVAFGGRIGGAIAPILTGTLIVMLVPSSESSLLQDNDFLDDQTLTRSLFNLPSETEVSKGTTQLEGPAADLRTEVLAQLSPELKTELDQFARSDETEFPDAVETRLLDELNDLLQTSRMFSDESLAAIPLPKEASDLREQSREQPLTELEQERLNRLVLEVISPGGVRQIYGRGWRPVMFIYGFVGVLVAGLFWYFYRNSPAVHPHCNQAEVALINANRTPESATDAPAGNIPWKRILSSTSIWCGALVQIGTNIGWTFIVTWLPRYLSQVHQVPLIERAWMTSLPMIFGLTGNLLGGFLTDWTILRFGPRWGRAIPISCTRFFCALAFLSCLWTESAWGVTGLMCAMAFGTDLGTASIWAFAQDIGGRFVGSVLGWGNMWGNLGGAVSPLLLNEVILRFSWDAMFLTCAASFAIVGVLALGINAGETVDGVV